MKARAAFTFVLVFTLSACGQRQVRLTTSPDIPAAQGSVKVSTTENGNTKIDLSVQHLAPPERVNPGATVYVVWVRGSEPGAAQQSLGALRIDDELRGSMTAVTPLRSFDLYITAEPSPLGAAPTGKTLLNTAVKMK